MKMILHPGFCEMQIRIFGRNRAVVCLPAGGDGAAGGPAGLVDWSVRGWSTIREVGYCPCLRFCRLKTGSLTLLASFRQIGGAAKAGPGGFTCAAGKVARFRIVATRRPEWGVWVIPASWQAHSPLKGDAGGAPIIPAYSPTFLPRRRQAPIN